MGVCSKSVVAVLTVSGLVIAFHLDSYKSLQAPYASIAAQYTSRPLLVAATANAATSTTGSNCEAVLDVMDQRFDYQRDMRHHLFETNVVQPGRDQRLHFDPYEPEAICFTEERFGGERRFGSLGDGPKFVCGVDFIASKDCLVYNIGSNNEIAFEQAVSKHIGCEIHTFDPTLDADYIGYNFSAFHPWGLGTEGDNVTLPWKKPFKTRSLNGIITELGHVGRKINILKIDCEGCEYTVMPVVFQSVVNGSLAIDQIQIELHAFGNKKVKTANNIRKFFEKADKAGFRIFHKERNHWGCKGYNCVEYSLVHRSFLREANAEIACGRSYSKVPSSFRYRI